jgi:hypothetical protein
VVEGLSGIDGMIQIQKMLQGMASVTKVEIGKLEGDKVTFNLAAGGQGRAGEGVATGEPPASGGRQRERPALSMVAALILGGS